MKMLIIFMIFSNIFFSGCSPSAPQVISNRQGRVKIFEVYSESPTNYPSERFLVLRVYDDKSIEFDSYPENPEKRRFPVQFELINTFIDDEQLSVINRSIKELSQEEQRSFYAPTVTMGIDSQITVTLNYDAGNGPKEIVIKENDSNIHLNTISSQPLRRLLKLSYEIRASAKK